MRSGRAAFDLSLAYGELREGEVARILALRGDKIEVKSDDMACVTHRLFVELCQRGGRPSGLAVTMAEWWVYRLGPRRLFALETAWLKELAQRAYEEGRYTEGGDNQNGGVLVPMEWLIQ